MSASILVVGAGGIGGRHLQSLASLDRPARLAAVEPCAQMRERARELCPAVQFVEGIEAVERDIDVAIVATTADARREVVERLLGRAAVRHLILEKVLFQRAADYEAVGTLIERRGVSAWVNCAQRMWPQFRALRAAYRASDPVELVVSGSNWGLGCNAIHNLDLLPYLTGDTAVELTAALDPGTVAAKRPGFVEFTGRLECVDRHGNRVLQTSLREGTLPLTMEVIIAGRREPWNLAEVPSQSDQTREIVAQLLDAGRCELPDYAESAALHLRMLKVFLDHLARHGDTRGVCAIT